jgi:hypothetical protein
MKAVAYYSARAAQVVGMWILLVDLFTASDMGPNPRLFALGVLVFLSGWGVLKFMKSLQ